MTFVCNFSEEEIASILQEYSAGADRAELCARYGISVRTLFRWQAKAGKSRPALLKLVSTLREENARLNGRSRDFAGVDGEDACAACGFWERRAGSEGLCRRYAPSADARGAEPARWPRTEAAEGCGEFDAAAPRVRCGDCAHWRGAGETGLCRRYAPRSAEAAGARATWRLTGAADFCGEGRLAQPRPISLPEAPHAEAARPRNRGDRPVAPQTSPRGRGDRAPVSTL